MNTSAPKPHTFLHKTVSGLFTIPSGIVTTSPSIIQRIIDDIPEIGVITTKSIGPVTRTGNREPVMTCYAPGCYMNAVGLTNPGADAAREQLAGLTIPDDRFLLTSIFAGSLEAFVEVAIKLAPVSDGLELNLSCPHAEGYGMDMGQDADMVHDIVKAVKQAVDVPVIPKLTPNVSDIRPIAEAAHRGGADAICAINTVGPAYFSQAGHPVLSNQYGGMSGRGILPIGLKCIKQIREVSDLPLIGCGGVSNAEDVKAYQDAGATVIGVGSALTGFSTQETKQFFQHLDESLTRSTPSAKGAISAVEANPSRTDMGYQAFTLRDNERLTDDIALLTFDGPIEVRAGEFIFLWIPGLGEKPFSVLDDNPFKLLVIEQGLFTKELLDLKTGTPVYTRGPYGVPVAPQKNAHLMLVGGGTGLAAVYQIARDFHVEENGEASLFVGARSADRLYYLEECKAVANLHIATDDGSLGEKGLVTDVLERQLKGLASDELKRLFFYNCGPEPMVLAAEKIQRKYVDAQQIYSAIDYLTKCGVGICGACGSPDGRRLCVDGPFLCIKDPEPRYQSE